MELTPINYKQSEVGLIPEDWEIKELGQLAKVIGGGTPKTNEAEYWNGKISWFTPTEVGKKKYLITSNRKITPEGLQRSSAQILPIGTILLTSRAGIGDLGILTKEAATNQGFQSLLVYDKYDNEYVYYLLSTLKPKLLSKASGSTFLEISPSNVKGIRVGIPSTLTEQKAIAQVLSDTDSLIEALEKKIAKKKLIKKGVMQKLLTPKKDWEVKNLGEIAEIYTGKKNNQDKVENGRYPFFVRSQIVESINTYSFDGEAILVPGEGNIGKIFHYINGKFDFHQRVYKISDFKDGYNGKYIYRYISEYFGMHAMENSVKATVDSLRLSTFEVFQIPFPPTFEEQILIAKILGDIDKEIENLEQKLSKYQLAKQGMMQQLLTGKIRLV